MISQILTVRFFISLYIYIYIYIYNGGSMSYQKAAEDEGVILPVR